MKGRCIMSFKKAAICFLALTCFLLATNISFGVNPNDLQLENEEYEQDLSRIKLFIESLPPSKSQSLPSSMSNLKFRDLKPFEKFADEMQSKWVRKNKRYYADLMLHLCYPLSSGIFWDEQQYVLARKYALSALKEPNEISLETELKLLGHVMTHMVTPYAPKGQKWAQLRKKDVEVRFHAWKRLTNAVDPNWDPNDVPFLNISATGIRPGIVPKDPDLRAEYDAAIEKMREIEKDTQKREWNSKQYRLRKLQKRFAPTAERYIVRAYSKLPFNLEELKQYLEKYVTNKKTRARILDAVKKNMEKQIQKMMKEPTMQ